jgi:uncharacterized protein YceK
LENRKGENMKYIFILLITLLLFSGCATKNHAYDGFEKSPCACFENVGIELENV